MKKAVWENKSNGQLCVTIPKDSGIKSGEVVTIKKEKIKTIIYSPIRADLFHYGHLRLLQNANKLGDLHICGILTDEAIKTYAKEPLASLKERVAIISALRCVDMVVIQRSLDPTENLKKIHTQFKNAKIILVYGSNWKKVPGAGYIKKIKGEIVQPPFYKRLSTKNVMSKLIQSYKNGL